MKKKGQAFYIGDYETGPEKNFQLSTENAGW